MKRIPRPKGEGFAANRMNFFLVPHPMLRITLSPKLFSDPSVFANSCAPETISDSPAAYRCLGDPVPLEDPPPDGGLAVYRTAAARARAAEPLYRARTAITSSSICRLSQSR
jgi:hypothetical protein